MREQRINLRDLPPLPPYLTETRDKEVVAMGAVVEALEKLDPDARGRVIDWAFARYVEPVLASENAPLVPTSNKTAREDEPVAVKTSICRSCRGHIVMTPDGWCHSSGSMGHEARPSDRVTLHFGGQVINP